MEFRKAVESDIDNIMNIIKQAQDYFKEHGIDQWQDNYPNFEIVMNDIENDYGYVMIEDDKVIGTAAVSFDGEKAYESICNGEWISNGEYAVIHRVAVDNNYKGKGLSTVIIKNVEKICLKRNVYSIKVDTHIENAAMQNVLKKNGFQYCGIICYDDNSERIAFEKIQLNLRADCEKCFGFCCVALYFSASDGFPIDKNSGIPCINLQPDFKCSVHSNLRDRGLKGCTSYDCFGAGQKVAQVTYGGHDWRKEPETSNKMFEVFLIMRQLNEMLWYLSEALTLQPTGHLHDEINSMFRETERFTFYSADSLLKLDLAAHGSAVNDLTMQVSELVRSKVHSEENALSSRKKVLGRGLDFIGANLRKSNLTGENLRGAYLIAADLNGVNLNWTDLMGTDMRDADIRGADLTNSIFVTQAQINTANGDSDTKLPLPISQPTSWQK